MRAKNYPKTPAIAQLPETKAVPMDLDKLAMQLKAKNNGNNS